MIEKMCFKCEIKKPIQDFYKHKAMSDGYLGKCKDCTKKDSKERLEFNLKNVFGFHEKEKERHRDKYYRLGYKEKHKKSTEESYENTLKYRNKYPEKHKAKTISQRLPCEKGNHLHHWSYNLEDAKDCIELNSKDHALIHRFLKYDQGTFKYKTLKGDLLNTKEKHLDYINSVLKLN